MKVFAALLAGAMSLNVLAETPYVESDGTYGLGFPDHAMPGMRIEVDFQLLSASGAGAVFGLENGNSESYFFFLNNYGWFEFGFPDSTSRFSGSLVQGDAERHTAIIDVPNSQVILKSQSGAVLASHAYDTKVTSVSTYPISAFGVTAANSYGNVHYRKKASRIYGIKIYNSGKLIRDYVPYVRDGYVGFRDRVNGFFVSSARATSTAFKVVGDWEEVDEDPYVASTTAGARVDTGYHPTGETRVECDYELLSEDDTNVDIFSSSRGESDFYMRVFNRSTSVNGNKEAIQFGGTIENLPNSNTHIGLRKTISFDALNDSVTTIIGGVTNPVLKLSSIYSYSPTSKSVASLAIFCWNANLSRTSQMRLYGFRIYEKGVLVHDYRPMKMDGVGILKDVVTGDWLKSNTATELTYGGANIKENNDGYLESDCTQGVNLGYYLTPKSRVEADVRFTKTDLGINEVCFGCGYNVTTAYTCGFAVSKGGNFEFGVPSVGLTGGLFTADLNRHRVYIDAPNKVYGMTRNGYAAYSATASSAPTATAGMPLGLFAATVDSNGNFYSSNYYNAPVRIYRIKIYEDGVLTKNWIPFMHNGELGLKELVSGTFVNCMKGRKIMPVAGGEIEYDEGCLPYLESDGTQYMNLGVYVTMTSRVESAFAYLKTDSYQAIVGNEGASGGLPIATRVSDGGNIESLINTKWKGYQSCDFAFHKVVIDIPNNQCKFTDADGTEKIFAHADQTLTADGTIPLGALAAQSNASGTEWKQQAKARLFYIKIYEGETLAHEFLPYKGSRGVGLYDTKTDTLVTRYDTTASEPVIAGIGTGFAVAPPESAKVAAGGATTINCIASGATSYKWCLDGEEIVGSTGDSLSLPWRHLPYPYTATVTVRPVYQLYGNTVVGDAQSTEVTFTPRGLMMLFR